VVKICKMPGSGAPLRIVKIMVILEGFFLIIISAPRNKFNSKKNHLFLHFLLALRGLRPLYLSVSEILLGAPKPPMNERHGCAPPSDPPTMNERHVCAPPSPPYNEWEACVRASPPLSPPTMNGRHGCAPAEWTDCRHTPR
jgi:hypothetical protein